MRLNQFLILIAISSLLLLSGCVATNPKRAQRQLSKALDHLHRAQLLDPSISLTKTDTITKEVIIHSVKRDSIFTSKVGDTVTITKDRLRIKYVRLKGDSVFVEGECKGDTVFVKVPCTSTTIIKRESYKDIVKRVLHIGNFMFYLIHVLILLGGLLWLYIKVINPRFL